jgi:hypothetical protein
MKKSVFSFMLLINITMACGTDRAEKTELGQDQQYTCPMDPDVIGKKGVKCTKCGMELTELVKEEK